MTRPTNNQRLFVAIYPSPWCAQEMLDALDHVDLPPGRRTPLEMVHLTVQFIGDVPSREFESVIESVERSVAGIRDFAVTPQRLISLPDRGPARLVAAETDSPAGLLELRRRLFTRFSPEPHAKASDRFVPHITLCRYDAEVRGSAQGARVNEPLDIADFTVQRVAVMKSVLRSEGSQHVMVAEFALDVRK